MFLKLDSDGVLYDQIYRALRGNILKGRLSAGARVPATRDLSLELGVSRNVAIMAYRQLLDEGYLTTRMGSGTFVARELPRHLTTVAARRRPRPARPAATIHLSAYARRVREASHGTQFTWEPRRDASRFASSTTGRRRVCRRCARRSRITWAGHARSRALRNRSSWSMAHSRRWTWRRACWSTRATSC